MRDNFDIKAASKTMRAITLDGSEVTLFVTNARSKYPVIGVIRRRGITGTFDFPMQWRADGTAKDRPNSFNLVNFPVKETREIWLNIYPGRIYATNEKEHAEDMACENRIACKKIAITFTHGEGLK